MRFLCACVLVLSACGADGSNPSPGGSAGGRGGSAGRPDAALAGAAGSASTGTGGSGTNAPATGGTGGTGGGVGGTADATPETPPSGGDAAWPETGALPDAGGPPDAAPAARNRCPAGPFEAPRAGEAKSICGNLLKYNWSEGPTWVASQKAFFFSNFVVGAAGPGDMLKYTPSTGVCETFLERVACNGLGVSNDGQILAACHGPRALMKYDPATKQGTALVKMADGRMLDSPNDVIQHSNGTIYFTNATYELAGRGQGLGMAVLRVDPAGVVSVINRGTVNGIGLSPDEKKLYVGRMGVWELDDAGAPQRRAGDAPLGGDGFAIDCAGNIYNQSGAIHGPGGQRLGSVPGGTNMAFGGDDGKLLLVVRNRSAQVVQMNVPGLP